VPESVPFLAFIRSTPSIVASVHQVSLLVRSSVVPDSEKNPGSETMNGLNLDFWVDTAVARVSQGMPPEQVFQHFAEELGTQRAEIIQAQFEKRTGLIRSLDKPRSLHRRGVRGWYSGPSSSDQFWPALESYLRDEKGWPGSVVSSIDAASSKIVGFLEHPGRSKFRTRGLVLGHVQSGKTANFTAVISKAADVTYRLFIVLSGMHNTLRTQTQRRLDAELLRLNPNFWVPLTDEEHDFGHQTLRGDALLAPEAHQRILAVVKKNSSRLRRLRDWLGAANPAVLRGCPVIVIDDEADQASLNAAKFQEERTRINELIIEILSLLPKHAYVGYTATPFANVLVDPSQAEDLYPRDFVVDLPKPARYFGPEKIFGRNPLEYDDEDRPDDGLDMIRRVAESEVPHLRPQGRNERESFEPSLVNSLERALRYFWMATAARRTRDQGEEHSSMLVHTSMLTLVHDRFAPVVSDFKERVADRLSAKDELELAAFREIWTDEVHRTPPDPSHRPTGFDSLEQHLGPVVSGTLVCIENNRSLSRLDYSGDDRIRIVIGGNTLSRGLTLEGLVVSYFVRSSGAYDTLLQMGRWFGYRDGYADLPRIWMTSELERHFRDLALVEEEIRRDIRRYEEYDLTPEELAVRIRVHPTLAVTSRLKMQAATRVQHSYSGDRPQTILFDHRDREVLRHNQDVTRTLIGGLVDEGLQPERKRGNVLLRHANPEHVLRFFREFEFHPENQRLRSDLLVDYVKGQLDGGRLGDWSVAVVGKETPDSGTIDLGLHEKVPLIRRSRLKDDAREYAYVGAIMSPGDQRMDLAKGETRPESQPLLLIYPIDRVSKPRPHARKRVPLDAVEDVIGVAVVFPTIDPSADTPTFVAVDLPPQTDLFDEPEDLPEDEDEPGEEQD
jgi:hypothetical protein